VVGRVQETARNILPLMCMCAILHLYIYGSPRYPRAGEEVVSEYGSRNLARCDGLTIATEESLHSRALPALRIRRGTLQLCTVWPTGKTAVFYLRAA
jgi:hypothetical protein